MYQIKGLYNEKNVSKNKINYNDYTCLSLFKCI